MMNDFMIKEKGDEERGRSRGTAHNAVTPNRETSVQHKPDSQPLSTARLLAAFAPKRSSLPPLSTPECFKSLRSFRLLKHFTPLPLGEGIGGEADRG